MTPRTVPGLAITETQLLISVKEMAQIFGWWFHHPWRSFHSSKGWPDVVLIRPPRLILAELKSQTGKLTPDQEHVLAMLDRCTTGQEYARAGLEVYVWRPADLDTIAKVLR